MSGKWPTRAYDVAEKEGRKRFWRELFCQNLESWEILRMDSVLRATAALPPHDNEALRLPFTFVAGSFGTNITIHDQQWRGIELAEAIIRIRKLKRGDGRRVCIIGGGFAGTAAALWLLKHDIDFLLVDKDGEILKGDFRNSRCWVHPNIWEWPLYDVKSNETYFPSCIESLNWEAGEINEVTNKVAGRVRRERGFMERVVKDQIEASDIQPHNEGVWVRINGNWEYFWALLICVGFGPGRQLRGAVKSSVPAKKDSPDSNFWNRCGTRYQDDTRHLVYGGGDTALMEAIQRCTAGFKQPYQLLESVEECGLTKPFKELGDRFRDADQEYEMWRGLAEVSGQTLSHIRRHTDSAYRDAVIDFFLSLHRDNLVENWERWVGSVLDWKQRVILAMRQDITRSRSARLNRVLCILLHAASRYHNEHRPKRKVPITHYPRVFEIAAEKKIRAEASGDPKDLKAFEKFRSDLFKLPLFDRGERELGEPENPMARGYDVDRGLMIVKNVEWIGQAEVDGRKPHHLTRVVLRGRSITVAGEYEEFVPCIGQEEPDLLRDLKEQVDINSLRIRQKDWKWYQ